jgi:hypothetical protein
VPAIRGAGLALCTLEPRCTCAPLGRCSVTGGASAPGTGVRGTGAPGTGVPGITECGCTSFAPVVIFCVGASRLSPAASRAPHPPQNRESGSFWVPQLEQRIPAQG